jgi:hypothetical protein
MSKGGGGYDTSGMQQAAAESNALQKEIYEESVQRGQPFYDVGVSGMQKLADYLGLQGGASNQSRGQIYESLSPQYTRQVTTGGGGADDAALRAEANRIIQSQGYYGGESDPRFTTEYERLRDSGLYGNRQQTTQEIDYNALNAAVDQAMAQQQQGRPDYFGSLLQSFNPEQLTEDPGYNFRLDEGQKALERRLAAQGKTFSPEAAKALSSYNQGMASQEYGNAYNRYNQNQTNIYNRLAGIAGIGQQQNAALTQAGQQYAGNVGQTVGSLANAESAAQQARASQGQSMFNTLIGAGASLGGAYLLSDERMKENIERVGEHNGLGVYEFNYKWQNDKRYRGVMAQEVLEQMPDAVTKGEGDYLMVDYSKLGINMEEVK